MRRTILAVSAGALALGAVLLAGCATTVSSDKEYLCGPRPDPSLAVTSVQSAVSQADFKDPTSVLIRGVRVGNCTMQPNVHGDIYGWRIDFQFNAKNSFGGYIGFHTANLLFNGNSGRTFFVIPSN